MKRFYPILFCVTALLVVSCGTRQSKESDQNKTLVTDMAGRNVSVPKKITRVFCSNDATSIFMNALAPDMLVGRNSAANKSQLGYIAEAFLKLPPLGFIFYGKSTLNVEELATLKPDALICPLFEHTTPEYITDFESYGEKLGIPVIMVDLDFEKLPEAFEFTGKLLGKQNEASALAEYCRQTFEWATSIRNAVTEPVSVYVAEGTNGLHTIPAGSTHSQTIRLAGVANCADVNEDYGYKDMPINMEQVLNWNPDYLLISSRSFSEKEGDLAPFLKSDKIWRNLRAVKENHILLIPSKPYNWIDRPPTINRLLGIKWLATSLYPEIATLDMPVEVSRFYSLFYKVDLTDEQLKILLK